MLIDGKLGIDLSQYETWRKADKDGKYVFVSPDFDAMEGMMVEWATIRKSQGIDAVKDQDPGFAATMQAADGKIERQPYHWYQPKRGTAAVQLATFLKGYIPGEYPPLLDLEDFRLYVAWRGIGSELRFWLDGVEKADGRTPEIYTSPGYIKAYFTAQDTWLRRYKLLLANYETSFPYVPQPYLPVDCAAWQITAKAYAPDYGVPIVRGYGSIKEAALYVRFE